MHGYHERTAADVPLGGRHVVVTVRVRRMRCPVLDCTVQTFREQVPGVLDRYQRRISRLTAQVSAVARELAGRASARLLPALGIMVSRHTALRVLLTIPLPAVKVPPVLGVDLSGVRTNFCRVFAGSDVADASATWSGGADAVLLEQAAEAEKLAVGGGELLFELADCGAAGVAFLAELDGEDVHDVAAVRVLRPGIGGRPGFLLAAELLDALPQVVVAVEEVEADPGGPGDGPEVDLLLVLDELCGSRSRRG